MSRVESRAHMPVHVKHIKFTIGITDFDHIKGRRIPGGSYFEDEAILVIDKNRVKGGLTHGVIMTYFEFGAKFLHQNTKAVFHRRWRALPDDEYLKVKPLCVV